MHENPASQTDLATVSIILSMVCLAFLLFDFPKPRILMGDTGSTFLGFLLATLAIYSGGKVATAFLVLGLPILDTIWAVLRRVYSGKKFWQGDLKHLHHRLLDLGASERLVVLFYLFVTSFVWFFCRLFCEYSAEAICCGCATRFDANARIVFDNDAEEKVESRHD